ncbi:MAG: peptidoglycan recognition protein family protein, partial [Oscillospiraceae bacterium]|nr:peptidoglycan recognition protein family protein [Oscillospiraceae bacterium]
MAILKPDKTTTLGGVTVNEYLLTKHNPNKIDMPSVSMEGRIIGVTVHNTAWITTAAGTTPAEQYTRATVNGNMNDVRVHYYVDNVCAWQNLPLTLSGWHAADGDGNGNRRTIAIECIMSSAYNDKDKKSEDNCARLAAALLKKYKLGINALYTHNHWYSGKYCPAYILPHWDKFKAKVQSYMNSGSSAKQLYRVRKSWSDAKSQIGAYSSLENAKKACKAGYSVFNNSGKAVYTKSAVWSKGQKVILSANTPLFASAETTTVSKRIRGTYYIYDGVACKNGRYRITSKADYCGKTPIGQYVTGYVS